MTLNEIHADLQARAPKNTSVTAETTSKGTTFILFPNHIASTATRQSVFVSAEDMEGMKKNSPAFSKVASELFPKTKAPVMTEEEMEAELGAANGTQRRSKK